MNDSRFIIIVIVFSAAREFARAENQPVPWGVAFEQEAPKAWEQYAVRARRLQGSFTITIRNVREGKMLYEARGEFKQREGCHLFLTKTALDGGKPSVDGEVSAENPHYAFRLRRAGAKPAWGVAAVGPGLWKPSDILAPVNSVGRILRTPYTFNTIATTMEVTLFDPGFTIDRVTQIERENGQLVKVEFRYAPVENAARKPLRSGWVCLDPKHYWVMREYEAKTQWGKEERNIAVSFQYVNAPDGFPILKQTATRQTIPSKNYESEVIHAYEMQERDPPEREFRLSAFDFPEPAGTPSLGDSRWYLWFIAAAIVSLAIGWYIWRRIQRRGSTAASESPT